MNGGANRKTRVVKRVRTLVRPAGSVPRRAYAHCFLEADGVHSRLHLHHFYSMFLPDIAEPVTVHVTIFDADGCELGVSHRRLDPFCSILLPVSELLSEHRATAAMGTVAVDVEPAPAHVQTLAEIGPDDVMVQSPFWMGFYGDDGSVAYIHSIDQYYGAVFGVGRLTGLAYKARWSRGGPWTSKRLVSAVGLERVDAYLVNHSPKAGRTAVRWVRHPDGQVVIEKSVRIAPRGVARISVRATDLPGDSGGAPSWLRLEVDDVLTANGKPYVMLRYQNGPFTLHHG